jgi:HK97 family phage major capsid protein
MKKSEQLREQMRGKWDEIKGIRDTVLKEERDFTEKERETVEATLEQVRSIEVEAQKEQKNEALIDQINGLNAMFTPGNGGGNGKQRQPAGSERAKSLGAQLVQHPVWQGWMKSLAPNGYIPDGQKGISSPPVEVADLLRKTLITGLGDTSAGAFVESERTGIYEPLGRHMLTMRDLISVRQTGSDTVEFVRQTAQVTQAAPVAEANVTTYAGTTGQVSGSKPEGAMTFERVTTTVKTIAVWVPATKRALSDASQLRGIIDDELRADLNEELENQMINGDGTGENLTGLNNTANVLAQPYVTDIVVTARKAITNLLLNGKQMPTGWLMNPADWEAYDLSTDDQGRYFWGGPMAMGPRTLWGVPVAQSYFQAAGTSWLGNWSKAVLWDREQAMITATDSHADFFIRNMVAILAELRAAFGIIRPTAFVEVDLTAGS